MGLRHVSGHETGGSGGLFAARHADRTITAENLQRYGAGARELFLRAALLTTAPPYAPQFAPDLIVTSAPEAQTADAGWHTVLDPEDCA